MNCSKEPNLASNKSEANVLNTLQFSLPELCQVYPAVMPLTFIVLLNDMLIFKTKQKQKSINGKGRK